LAREEADRANQNASELERQIYALSLQQAESAILTNDRRRARELLQACPLELMGWEWDHLWWQAQSEILLTLPGQRVPEFTPEGNLVSKHWGPEFTIRLWDLKQGALVREYPIAAPGAAVCNKFEHIFGLTRVNTEARDLVASEIETGKILWRQPFTKRFRTGSNFALSPDGSSFATQSPDTIVTLQNMSNGRQLAQSQPINATLRGAEFSPDGSKLAMSYAVLDGSTLEKIVDLQAHPVDLLNIGAGALAWSPDGERIATGDRDGKVRVWDAQNGTCILTVAGMATNDVAFSHRGEK
jgi:hypothetical protein